jgi:hypothetical protein
LRLLSRREAAVEVFEAAVEVSRLLSRCQGRHRGARPLWRCRSRRRSVKAAVEVSGCRRIVRAAVEV